MIASFIIQCLSWQVGKPKKMDQCFVRVARDPAGAAAKLRLIGLVGSDTIELPGDFANAELPTLPSSRAPLHRRVLAMAELPHTQEPPGHVTVSPTFLPAAPRASNGKPDLSGVWHVDPTPMDEQKRLFGANIDQIALPGMEPDTRSKYGMNVLVDFKPEDSPMKPEGAAILRSRSQFDRPSLHCLPWSIPTLTLTLKTTAQNRADPWVDRHDS